MPSKKSLIHPLTKPLESSTRQRFHKYVDKSLGHGPKGDCWVWTGCKNSRGYGTFGISGWSLLAHRVGFALANGPFDHSKSGCHRCDNPACVRPEHIFLGTNSENQLDSSAKGRHRGTRQTICAQGHDYTPENTYIAPKSGKRMCQICIKIRTAQATERERNLRNSSTQSTK